MRHRRDRVAVASPPATLSERESLELLARYGVPVARHAVAGDPAAAARAARALGFPVAVKLCGRGLAHKTDRGLVRLGLADARAVRAAASELLALRRPEDGTVSLLVAEMVAGRRELLAGLVRDPQFGACVLVGLGGILAEALDDVVLGVAPVTALQARRMLFALRGHRLITAPFRGEPAADLDAVSEVLVALGRLGAERRDVESLDVNPLILRDGRPVAVDALVALRPTGGESEPVSRPLLHGAAAVERFAPLFEPRGIVVAGASSHPGKFGFVALHNLLRFGFAGPVYPVNREGGRILDQAAYRDVRDIPAGEADLVFVCTPPAANVSVLRACRAAGVRAAFVASGGYAEAGPEGRALEQELVETADALGMVLAGPNGQGVISTGRSMCAQIVAPYPPAGRIGVVSQSGNIVSSLLNYAVLTGIGVSKSLSCGNAAQTTLADYLAYFAADPGTDAVVAYLEGVGDGRRFVAAVEQLTARKPLILVKGGVASEGRRAAASHTGSLATDHRVFAGFCRQFGVLQAPSVETAFEWAATFVTQPLPRGRRVGVLTSAGGWGVLAADAAVGAGLEVQSLPEDLRAELDALLPARWSHDNPIDLAGGETRDTIPRALDLVAGHSDLDAVVYLGIGIQANQAHAFRSGGFYPRFGLDRIVEFHERQDRRYAEAAVEASARHRKPVLVATELVYADRAYGNAAPLSLRAAGRLCYPSAHRAIEALRALVEYAEHRRAVLKDGTSTARS
jgi:acetyltransferase